jgi:hypothetical protein
MLIKHFLAISLSSFILILFLAVPAQAAAFTGDANNDGKVDGIDYIFWLNNYGRTGANAADFNQDLKVDGIDYVIWFNNYGKTPTGQTVKVFSIAYYPINSNNMLDTTIVNNNWGEYNLSLDQVRAKVNRIYPAVAANLTAGTKYKGYKNPDATAYLNYNVVSHVEKLEAMPISNITFPLDSNNKTADYRKIMSDINVCNLVDNQQVREIWIWGYTGIGKGGWESNFASSYGDISNSDRNPNDLPTCNHSYTVYDYNYGRDISEAMEDHMHQFESIFGWINYDLFWNKYAGSNTSNPRRCGNAHFPPNGTRDYDWYNQNPQNSDCLDWKPDTLGQITPITCNTWNCDSIQYFIFWMQNVPNINSGLTYQGHALRNWWDFIGDFDAAMITGRNLVQ